MGKGFAKYFNRDYYRRVEKKLDVKKILCTWAFNFLVSGAVFLITWLAFGSVFITIIYTLSAWTVTLTVSIMYWLSWIFREIEAKSKVKIAASLVILIMFAAALAVIWQTFVLVLQLTNV
jgi:hypothetical protein